MVVVVAKRVVKDICFALIHANLKELVVLELKENFGTYDDSTDTMITLGGVVISTWLALALGLFFPFFFFYRTATQ